MIVEQNPVTTAQTTRMVIDRFNETFNRGVDVFTVRDGKVAAKLAYVKG